jgi:hypothetical protein
MSVCGGPVGPPSDTSPAPIGFGGNERIFSGFAWNFATQPAEQKKYCFSLWSALKRAFAGFTSIPQTGSFALTGKGVALGGFTGCSISFVARSLS